MKCPLSFEDLRLCRSLFSTQQEAASRFTNSSKGKLLLVVSAGKLRAESNASLRAFIFLGSKIIFSTCDPQTFTVLKHKGSSECIHVLFNG